MLYGSLSIAVIGPFVIPAQLSLIQIDLKKISYCRIRPDIAIDKKFKLNLSALLRYVCMRWVVSSQPARNTHLVFLH